MEFIGGSQMNIDVYFLLVSMNDVYDGWDGVISHIVNLAGHIRCVGSSLPCVCRWFLVARVPWLVPKGKGTIRFYSFRLPKTFGLPSTSSQNKWEDCWFFFFFNLQFPSYFL